MFKQVMTMEEEMRVVRAMMGPDERPVFGANQPTPTPALMPRRRVTAEMLAAQAPVRLAWVSDTDHPAPPEREMPCLGSDGVISTSACNRLALRRSGRLCPLCSL